MKSKKKFIEYLLDESKDFNEGVFFPNPVELKIKELENFNSTTAIELSQIEVEYELFTQGNTETISKVKLITIKNDTIEFYPTVLKKYLKKL